MIKDGLRAPHILNARLVAGGLEALDLREAVIFLDHPLAVDHHGGAGVRPHIDDGLHLHEGELAGVVGELAGEIALIEVRLFVSVLFLGFVPREHSAEAIADLLAHHCYD